MIIVKVQDDQSQEHTFIHALMETQKEERNFMQLYHSLES